MMPSYGGIYKISIEDYFYIGRSVDINVRIQRHLWALNAGKHHNTFMQNVYNKHKDFSFKVIATVTSFDYLDVVEQHFIDMYFDHKLCMNLVRSSSGGGPSNHTQATILKNKMSQPNRKPVIVTVDGASTSYASIGDAAKGTGVGRPHLSKVLSGHRPAVSFTIRRG